MKRIILVNGLIAGAIVCAMMLINVPLHQSGALTNTSGMVLGFASMVIAFSTIFFGVKTYRDQYSNGAVNFWQAAKIGIGIACIASVFYAATWEVYYSYKGEEFITFYKSCEIQDFRDSGHTEAEVLAKQAEMDEMFENYRYAFVRIPMTLLEILPVGIVVSLITAALLRRREFLPA
jgi:hypothetical protein